MFKGNFTAIVTPFKDGNVDFDGLGELIEYQIQNGIHGIVPCGTTGESATLSEEEHRKVIEYTIGRVKGRVPVLAGTGSNSTTTAVELTRHAKAAGADGALVITPYYNKPTQEGLFRHFQTIAGAVDIPLVLYNVPGRTGVNMLPETVARLAAACANIVGLKDATGNLVQASRTLELIRKNDFTLLSGEDALVYPMLAIGAMGVISVFSNIAPASMSELVNSFFKGDTTRARELHYRQLALCDALFMETNPIPVKTALKLLGRGNGELRSPMCPMQDVLRAKLEQALRDFKLL